MSGGSWDYFFYKLQEVADRLICESANPLRVAFGRHLSKCSKALRAIEWFDSGDNGPDDEIEPIQACLNQSTDVSDFVVSELKKHQDFVGNLIKLLESENKNVSK